MSPTGHRVFRLRRRRPQLPRPVRAAGRRGPPDFADPLPQFLVHNAAAGYWGIATGAMAPCQVICAYDASFARACSMPSARSSSTGRPRCSSPTTASTCNRCSPSGRFPTWPVSAGAGAAAHGTLAGADHRRPGHGKRRAAGRCRAGKPAHRHPGPACRLPLLRKLALGEGRGHRPDHLPPMQLGVAIQPC